MFPGCQHLPDIKGGGNLFRGEPGWPGKVIAASGFFRKNILSCLLPQLIDQLFRFDVPYGCCLL